MMALTATIKSAATVVTSLGIIGAGALTLDNMHAPQEQVDRMQASNRVGTILELVSQAANQGSAEWICRAIEAEFASLCTEMPDHYWCDDPDAKRSLFEKAGCR